MAFSFRRRRQEDDKAEMSFVDHLEVLRGHLFRSLVAVMLGAIVVGVYNKFFIKKVLMGPTHNDFPTYAIMCRAGRAPTYILFRGKGLTGLNRSICVRPFTSRPPKT